MHLSISSNKQNVRIKQVHHQTLLSMAKNKRKPLQQQPIKPKTVKRNLGASSVL